MTRAHKKKDKSAQETHHTHQKGKESEHAKDTKEHASHKNASKEEAHAHQKHYQSHGSHTSHAKTKQSKKPTEKRTLQKRTPWIISTILLGVLLVASLATGGFGIDINKNDGMTDSSAIGLTIVTAEDCSNCEMMEQQIVKVSKQLFKNATFDTTTVTKEDEKGQELIEQYDLTKAPSFIFGEQLSETKGWSEQAQVQQSFNKQDDGSYKLLDQATGATYYLDDEKRKQQEAKMESYPEENMKALNATGDKPRLDYFVMAFCPYGNPADKSASELHEFFGDKVEIVPHYILSTSGGNIKSLHGKQEGNQGVRELCALQELGKDAYFNFTLAANDQCSAENADSCWEDAAESAGVDTQAIKDCYDANRLSIAQSQDDTIKSVVSERQGQLTPPTASPTFLINGETFSESRDTKSLKNALCNEFDDAPAQCDDTIDPEAQTASTGQC